MIRWGVLSTAKIAREQLIPAHMQSTTGNIVAVASRLKEKAVKLAEEFGIPKAYGSYEALLADPEIDAVIIPLPTSQHVEWTLKAAAAGKHVLCEKPIALHASEINDLKEAAKKHNVIITEGFMVTHNPQWQKVRELVAKGAIGRLRHVQGAFSYYNIDPNNMRNIAALGGGGLPDIGVYPTITTRFVTGKEPKRVHAEVAFDRKFKTDCYASVKADFGDFELTFYCSTQMALRQFMVFHGEEGFIEIDAPFNTRIYDHARITLHNQTHTEATQFTFGEVNHYQLQAEAIERALITGEQGDLDKLVSLDSSLNNQKLIDAIYTAGKSAEWEKV